MQYNRIYKNLQATPWLFAIQITLLAGCSNQPETSQSGEAEKSPPALATQAPYQVHYSFREADRQQFEAADLRILFIGNSHTQNSPELLGKLFTILHPEKKVWMARTMGGFLVGHSNNEFTLKFLRYGKWDFVVLQGQKYSTSGKYHYPIDGALKLAEIAEGEVGAKVILFPEWSRKNMKDEYLRINKIHSEIAGHNKAAIAPIGLAWEKVTDSIPNLKLYEPDGNHATSLGHFINAIVFYRMIMGAPVELAKLKTGPKASSLSQLELRIAETIESEVPFPQDADTSQAKHP